MTNRLGLPVSQMSRSPTATRDKGWCSSSTRSTSAWEAVRSKGRSAVPGVTAVPRHGRPAIPWASQWAITWPMRYSKCKKNPSPGEEGGKRWIRHGGFPGMGRNDIRFSLAQRQDTCKRWAVLNPRRVPTCAPVLRSQVHPPPQTGSLPPPVRSCGPPPPKAEADPAYRSAAPHQTDRFRPGRR